MTETLFERYKEALRAGHVAVLQGRLEDAAAPTARRSRSPATAPSRGRPSAASSSASASRPRPSSRTTPRSRSPPTTTRRSSAGPRRSSSSGGPPRRPRRTTAWSPSGRPPAATSTPPRPPAARSRSSRPRSGGDATTSSPAVVQVSRPRTGGRRARTAVEIARRERPARARVARRRGGARRRGRGRRGTGRRRRRGRRRARCGRGPTGTRGGASPRSTPACSGIGARPADVELHLLLADLTADAAEAGPSDARHRLLRLAELDGDAGDRARAGRDRVRRGGRSAGRRRGPDRPLTRRRPPAAGACPPATGGPGGRCYTHATMSEVLESIAGQVRLTTIIDIGLTALVIYWVFSLIRGTRAVRLVIGVSVILLVYARGPGRGPPAVHPAPPGRRRRRPLRPRRGLPARAAARPRPARPGRLARPGSCRPPTSGRPDRVAAAVARAAARLAAARVVARSSSSSARRACEEIAETGVMIHGDLTADLLEALFAPRAALHDGAVDRPRRDDPRRRRAPAAGRD